MKQYKTLLEKRYGEYIFLKVPNGFPTPSHSCLQSSADNLPQPGLRHTHAHTLHPIRHAVLQLASVTPFVPILLPRLCIQISFMLSVSCIASH
ncbi:mCG1044782 [Mus musculus]|nr:mCG1044782 [Mus musculus]